MPKFTKEIIPPGRYRAPDPTDGMVRKWNDFTPSRLKGFVSTFQKMKDVGIKIPAPFRHNPKIASLTPAQAASLEAEQREKGSLLNAGYWDDLFIDSNTGKLCGVLDVPSKEVADKIGNSIQECSLMALPEFEDGLGNKWKDGIVHIALVTNPIVPGQENFQQLPETVPGIAASMSLYVEPIAETTTDPASDATLSTATNHVVVVDVPANDLATAAALANSAVVNPADPSKTVEKSDFISPNDAKPTPGLDDAIAVLTSFGIDIQPGTTIDDLCRQIVQSGNQVLAAKQNAVQVSKDFTVVTNHVGGASMALTEFAVDTPQGKLIKNQHLSRLESRITNLVQRGFPKTYLDETVRPMLVGCQMSLCIDDEGNVPPTEMDKFLDLLEKLPTNALLTGNSPEKVNAGQFSVEEPHSHAGGSMSQEDVDRLMGQVFKNCGMKSPAA